MSGKVCYLQERELARVRLRFCSLQIVLFMPAVSASFCLCGWAGVAWWCLPVLPSWFAGLFSSSPLSVWPSRPCQEVSPGTSPLSTRWAKMRLCAPLRYCFDSDLAVVRALPTPPFQNNQPCFLPGHSTHCTTPGCLHALFLHPHVRTLCPSLPAQVSTCLLYASALFLPLPV